MLSHCCVSVTLLELLMIYTLAAPLVSHVNDNYFSLYTFSVIHKHRAVLDHSSLIAQRPACKLLVHSCEVTPWNLNLFIIKEKHWWDCVLNSHAAPVKLSSGSQRALNPNTTSSIIFFIYWADQSRLWNGVRKCSQNSALWFHNTIHAAQFPNRSQTCLEQHNAKFKIRNRGGALGVFYHLVA